MAYNGLAVESALPPTVAIRCASPTRSDCAEPAGSGCAAMRHNLPVARAAEQAGSRRLRPSYCQRMGRTGATRALGGSIPLSTSRSVALLLRSASGRSLRPMGRKLFEAGCWWDGSSDGTVAAPRQRQGQPDSGTGGGGAGAGNYGQTRRGEQAFDASAGEVADQTLEWRSAERPCRSPLLLSERLDQGLTT